MHAELPLRGLGKAILSALGLILACAILGVTLLAAVYTLPRERMRDHVIASAVAIQSESGYPRLIKDWPITMLDTYTDTIMLLAAAEGKLPAYVGKPLREVAEVPREVYFGGDWLIAHFDAYAKAGLPVNGGTVATYPRYWHGYLLFLKPLLMLFDYQQLRLLNMIAQMFLLFAVLYAMTKRLGLRYAVALLAGVVCLIPPALAMSLQFSTCYYIAMLSILAILRWDTWLQSGWRCCLAFCCIGILTNYFDYLTYPLITWGVPVCVFLLTQQDAGWKKALTITAATGAFWLMGYALMWVSKWGFATLVTGQNAFLDAFSAISDRTSLTVANGQLPIGDITRWKTVTVLIGMLKRRPFLLLAAAILLGTGIAVLRKQLVYAKDGLQMIPGFLLVACGPLVWYCVLPNHSYIHYFFTYRTLVISVFALLCAFMHLFANGMHRELCMRKTNVTAPL